MRVRTTADTRGKQAAMWGVLQGFGAVRLGEGGALVGGIVLPQAFRVGVDVQRLDDVVLFAVVADGDSKLDVAADGRRAVDAARIAVPGEAAVLPEADVKNRRIGRQFPLVGLTFVGRRQRREGDVVL